MSKKSVLRKEIEYKEQEIEAIEKKLFRSQTMLILAIVEGNKPDRKEVEYFKMYTELIDSARRELKSLIKQLEDLG